MTLDLFDDLEHGSLRQQALAPGALLLRKQKPVYQLCTSDRNPLPMRRLVELTALSNRAEHRKETGTMSWLGQHLEAVVVSQNTYDLASRTIPRILEQGAELMRDVVGAENQSAKKIEPPKNRRCRGFGACESGKGAVFPKRCQRLLEFLGERGLGRIRGCVGFANASVILSLSVSIRG